MLSKADVATSSSSIKYNVNVVFDEAEASQISKSDLSFLRFVCDWLVTFARFETLSDAVQQCLRATKFADLAELLMLKVRAEIDGGDWLKISKTVLSNKSGCAEADLIAGSGPRAVELYAGLSILSPMLEMRSGRIWRHRGRHWDALAEAILL